MFDIKEWSKQYYQKNKEEKLKYSKEYQSNNKEKQKKYFSERKEYYKQYKEKNKEKVQEVVNKYHTKRRNEDPNFALAKNIRSLIYRSFEKKSFNKNSNTANTLGCSLEEFRQHIESQFEPWMNWDNRGGKLILEPNTYWDIDHIIPLSTAKTAEDVIKLNHYSNLKPLCSYYNRFIKRNKIN
jgi:hypothetical protein